jgi:hypothetical protein
LLFFYKEGIQMAFTFPTDSNSKAGAVHANGPGTDFYVPTREQGSESITGSLANVTTAGTRIQLPAQACREVTIIALRSNTSSIFVGGSNVSSTVYGAELLSRDTITIKVSDASLIYMDSSVNGEGVSYLVI